MTRPNAAYNVQRATRCLEGLGEQAYPRDDTPSSAPNSRRRALSVSTLLCGVVRPRQRDRLPRAPYLALSALAAPSAASGNHPKAL